MFLATAPKLGLIGRHVLSVIGLASSGIGMIIGLASYLEGTRASNQQVLGRDKTLVLLFEKPNLRTRVSFEVAMTYLGGHALFASGGEFIFGSRETPEDAARVLCRYVDAISVGTHAQEPLIRFSAAPRVP